MKKLLASFAVFIYFAFVTGVMVNTHFCMDRYDSYSFYKAQSDWCPKCHMHTGTRRCCHDEVKIIKLQDDHQTSSVSFAFKELPPAVIMPSEFFSVVSLKEDIDLAKTDHSPPLLSSPDINLQNRVFRI